MYFLIVVLALSVYGCFGSRERGDKVDSGLDGADVTIENGGTGGRDTSRAGSGAIDGRHVGVAGGIDIDDDAGMSEAPCTPNCPSLEWVTIPGGTFMMGSAEGIGNDNERPQHEVTVQTFRMSKTEVTVAQYDICVDKDVCSVPLNSNIYNNWGKSGRENHPVNSVEWHQAREFAEWIGARLPSEAEWEFAARSGGRDIIYPWGNEDATCERAVIIRDESGNSCGNETTMEVCSKPLGNTMQGLCDMAGNVSEWVEDDWHNGYNGAPSDGQAWIGILRDYYLRVLRGGSWLGNPDSCRSAYHNWSIPDYRFNDIGFRIVLDLR